MGEMLVQSHTKYLDLLPALPTAFVNGEVKGICARGGFVLNIKWQSGKLQSLSIFSIAGNDCQLRYGNKVINLKTEKGKTYSLNGDLQSI